MYIHKYTYIYIYAGWEENMVTDEKDKETRKGGGEGRNGSRMEEDAQGISMLKNITMIEEALAQKRYYTRVLGPSPGYCGHNEHLALFAPRLRANMG